MGYLLINNYYNQPMPQVCHNPFMDIVRLNFMQYLMNNFLNFRQPSSFIPQTQMFFPNYHMHMPQLFMPQQNFIPNFNMQSCFCAQPVQNSSNPFLTNNYQNFYPGLDLKKNTNKNKNKSYVRKSENESFAKKSTNVKAIKSENGGKIILDGNNEYVKIAREKAKKYGVDEKLVLAIIKKESNFINKQTSGKGAQGLMQLMPDTAKEYGIKNPNDPEQNIDGGVRYFKKLLNMYNGDITKALAAYNWGAGNLNKKGLANAPFETRDYIAKITNWYKKIEIA